MKNLLRLLAGKIPVVRINTFVKALNWKIYLLVSDFKKRHSEQHRNNYSILHKIWPVQEKIEIVLIFSFFKFWFLIYIQIASNNHDKLMKTLSCTVNKSVPRYMPYYYWRMILHCNSHDTLKLGSNIWTLLDCYVFTRLNGIVTFDIW